MKGSGERCRPLVRVNKADPVVDSADRTAVEWSRVQETFELAVLDALPLSHQHQDRDRSRLQVLWWSVRRRLARSQHCEEHQYASSTATDPSDGDWVVLAHVSRTRLAGGAENMRVTAGARRTVR
jgi:hypothetical protein